MLSPLLLLMLKKAEVSTTLAGLFAATTWLGIFAMTPFASQLTRALGRRQTMWLASIMPIVATVGFMLRASCRAVTGPFCWSIYLSKSDV